MSVLLTLYRTILLVFISLLPVFANATLPVRVYLDGNGLLAFDTPPCAIVDTDGLAHFVLTLPDDYESKELPDNRHSITAHKYNYHGIYISVPSANQQGATQMLSYHRHPGDVNITLPSPGHVGQELCLFTPAPIQRLKSLFEIYGRWAAETFSIRMIEAYTGQSFKNMAGSWFWGALPHFMMLENQLTAGEDIKNHIQHANGQSKVSVASISFLSYATALSLMPKEPITELSTLGSFRLFGIASMCNHLLDAVDYGVVKPAAGYIFPGNGSVPNPATQMISDFFRSYIALLALYIGQTAWVPEGSTASDLNIPDEMVSMTIVTTINSRQFVVNLNNRYFWKNIPLLQILQDGVISIAIASIKDPSHVAYLSLDTYLKEIAAAALSTAEENQDDSYTSWSRYAFNAAILWSGIHHYAPSVTSTISHYGQAAISVMPLRNQFGELIGQGYSLAGSTLSWVDDKAFFLLQAAGKKIYVPIGYIASKLPNPLPRTVGSGYPSIYHNKVKTICQAAAVFASFRYLGPSFASLFQSCSDYLYQPDSTFNWLFRSDREATIEHYHRDSTN